MRSTPSAHHAHLGRRGRAVVELDPLAQRRAARPALGSPSTSTRYSLATPWEGWVSSWVSVAVVGQHQQALGVLVEAPDREHPGLVGNEVGHGGSALGVRGGGHHPGRLVQAGSGRGRGRPAPGRRRRSPRPRARRPADRGPATSPSTVTRPSGDQLLAGPAAAVAERGRAPSAGARRRVSCSAVDVAHRAGGRAEAVLELAHHLGAGQEVLDRRAVGRGCRGRGAPRTARWCRRAPPGPGRSARPPPRCSRAARAGGPPRRRSRHAAPRSGPERPAGGRRRWPGSRGRRSTGGARRRGWRSARRRGPGRGGSGSDSPRPVSASTNPRPSRS